MPQGDGGGSLRPDYAVEVSAALRLDDIRFKALRDRLTRNQDIGQENRFGLVPDSAQIGSNFRAHSVQAMAFRAYGLEDFLPLFEIARSIQSLLVLPDDFFPLFR